MRLNLTDVVCASEAGLERPVATPMQAYSIADLHLQCLKLLLGLAESLLLQHS